MFLSFLIILISFAALLWAAHYLVSGALGMALHYQWPPFAMGLTLMALGTSVPEMIIAITASKQGWNDIALGNGIGSNIANIGLVLGLLAIFRPIRIQNILFHREYPLLFLVMLFTYSLMIGGYLGVLDGCLLLLMYIALIVYFMIRTQWFSLSNRLIIQFHHAKKMRTKLSSSKKYIFQFIFGFIILAISAEFLVKEAASLAFTLGVSQLFISLTIIAFGSSLPELATSFIALKKGADDIAVGNILGSNIFNLLSVMLFPSFIHPGVINKIILWRDLPVLFFITLLLLWFSHGQQRKISRWQGGVLLLIYCCYMVSMIISAFVN